MATPGRLPAALLVVVVFVCHGLFGAAHQTFAPATGAHGHHAQAAAHGEGHAAGHLAGGAEYAAVLVSILIGTALGLVLRAIQSPDAMTVLHPADRRLRIAAVWLHPPRGPTLSALQVFRL
ncbi:MAG: hypothetical protein M3Q54_07395 [Actinomycetota bacterium]|nr:hypothetical protein [Actinomycetota bacterium]